MKPFPAGLAARALLAALGAAALLTAQASLAAPAAPAAVSGAQARSGPARPARPVVIIGIPGLRWTDISRRATPALWRLAEHGSVGSLVVSAVRTYTCPADAWLTLNAGARAMAPRPAPHACAPLPAVVHAAGSHAATVPALSGGAGIEAYNRQFSYGPEWGLLATAAGPGGCAAAAGPGAALAVASRSGDVADYAGRTGGAIRSAEKECGLVVADLGALPATGSARQAAVRAADAAAGRIIAAAPPGAVIMAAGLGDGSAPHLRAVIVSGPGFGTGLLRAASTRQPGLVLSTDLTPSVLQWRGQGASLGPGVIGSPLRSAGRGPLAPAVTMLTGQDTAVQVSRSTLAPYFLSYGFSLGIVFGLIALVLRGDTAARRQRRRAAYRVAAMVGGAVPAGSFLGGLAPWPTASHPALLLYGTGLAGAVVIAAAALAGPWRRDPLGGPGFIGVVTVAVIGADVITGSHLLLATPFGLSALTAGRYYGIGNDAIGTYAIGGLLAAAWAGAATARRTGRRGRAVAAGGAVALLTVVVAAWPGFGAKVGGTIAMVPSFLVLLAGLAGIRITPRRGAVIAVSGIVLIAVFAVLNYLVPATGASDIGAFVGHVLHGGATAILRRKVATNVSSLTENWATPIIPLVVIVTGLMLAWPDRLRLRMAAAAMAAQPLLRPLLTAIWLIGAAGWLANDSGVTVTSAALPLALPMVIAIVTGFGLGPGTAADISDLGPGARTAPATDRAG
ncbi:MAG TPA: hypothetical protein VK586_09795 [Streptosporangiaceae bacterium]|nr:hypothetical protein [Streptosporangiaceae bacterium]